MDDWRDYVLLAGVLILVVTSLRMLVIRRKQSAGAVTTDAYDRSPREVPGSSGSHEGMNDVLVDLERLGREMEGRLTTRVQYATKMMEESEHVLQRLDSVLDQAKQAIHQLDARIIAAGQKVDSSRSEPVETEMAPVVMPAELEGPVSNDPDEKQILERAERGESSEQIAEALSRPVGEVGLVLNLCRTKIKKDS